MYDRLHSELFRINTPSPATWGLGGPVKYSYCFPPDVRLGSFPLQLINSKCVKYVSHEQFPPLGGSFGRIAGGFTPLESPAW